VSWWLAAIVSLVVLATVFVVWLRRDQRSTAEMDEKR
jgi:hypothetical protein